MHKGLHCFITAESEGGKWKEDRKTGREDRKTGIRVAAGSRSRLGSFHHLQTSSLGFQTGNTAQRTSETLRRTQSCFPSLSNRIFSSKPSSQLWTRTEEQSHPSPAHTSPLHFHCTSKTGHRFQLVILYRAFKCTPDTHPRPFRLDSNLKNSVNKLRFPLLGF